MQKLTDYSRIQRTVERLLQPPWPPFAECVQGLERVSARLPGLHVRTNPVAAQLSAWTAAQARFLILEYIAFANHAVHMLLEARIRTHWKLVREELVRNLEEEFGLLTRGVPHLELMRHGLRADLGIETENAACSAVTRGFIDRMNSLFRAEDDAVLAGHLLAFEAVAAEEFRIVGALLNRCKALQGGELARDSLTARYVGGHVSTEETGKDPEQQHLQGMKEAVAGHVDPENQGRFVRGFLEVCLNLSVWWEELAIEARTHPLRCRLTVTNPQRFDVAQVFRSEASQSASSLRNEGRKNQP